MLLVGTSLLFVRFTLPRNFLKGTGKKKHNVFEGI